MPELPEVETTRRGIAPHVEGQRVADVVVRQPRLRWPIPRGLKKSLDGKRLERVERRAKYLLLRFSHGTLIIHLGMSGSLRIVDADAAPGKHDHFDLVLDNGRALRLTDPRRFGAVLWERGPVEAHELIAHLGPEPLSEAFDSELLWHKSRGRKQAVKAFIMDGKVVVGVGNIYASESLYLAGINPKTPAGRISRERYARLAAAIKQVLTEAIKQGGTTLRDFVGGDGTPGYFAQQLNVYGREGEACPGCGGDIRQVVLGQRASFYCPRCQR